MGLGCVKTQAPVAHVETSRRNCASESQIILRPHGSIPCRRIAFSTFCRCMSFYTARVRLGHCSDVRCTTALPPKAEVHPRSCYVAHVPGAVIGGSIHWGLSVAGRVRRTGFMECQSGLICAVRITSRHFSVSSAISLPKSAGEPGSAVAPRSAIRALILGSASPAFISLLVCRLSLRACL
jgi:hypothetical protein